MDHDYLRRNHQVPAFGSWEWNQDLPFTQCFESARQASLLRYATYCDEHDHQDRDLYVTGDLYQRNMVAPAMIVVPRRRKKPSQGQVKAAKGEIWVMGEVKEQPSPPMKYRHNPKPVDEDLYKISPELLYSKAKKDIVYTICCNEHLVRVDQREINFWLRPCFYEDRVGILFKLHASDMCCMNQGASLC